MMAADRTRRLAGSAILALWLAAIGMTRLPSTWTERIKEPASVLVHPGRMAASAGSGRVSRAAAALVRSDNPRPDHRADVMLIEQRLRTLEALLRANDRQSLADRAGPERWPTEPLLSVSAVEVRSLGRQALSAAQHVEILGAGRLAGLRTGNLVVEPSIRFIDVGDDGGLARDDLLLAGRRVWGRLVEVAPLSSVAEHVSSVTFRDVVEIVPSASGIRGPFRGLLEGSTSGPKVRGVDVTVPVSVGDVVVAAVDPSIKGGPFLYGTVAEARREPGAAHWEIMIRPALAAGEESGDLAVLRIGLNPRRRSAGGLAAADSPHREVQRTVRGRFQVTSISPR